MKISQFTLGPFQENCYLVVDEQTQSAALVDPGDDGARLLKAVRDSGALLEAIWLTHGHLDHVGGVAAIRRELEVPILLHPDDRPLYDRVEAQAAAYGLPFDPPPPPDAELVDGQRLQLGSLAFEVMHTPGHAPGLVVIHGHGVAFVSDLLFAGSIGRTDLPLSDSGAMMRSLQRVCTLPDATVLYPGHGPVSTLARERQSNPFLNGMARVVGA